MKEIDEIFHYLKQIDVIETRKEFCTDWLNRSECYFRTLKHYERQPSLKVIALLSHKLKHYGSLLLRQNNATKQQIGETLLTLHADCERCIHERCKRVWLTEMGSTE